MEQKTHFFRPLIPGFLTKFCIPKSFILKHPDLIESTDCDNFVAVLKDKRSGSAGIGNVEHKTWRVRVDSDGRRFLDGWREFADDHSLRVGDFLVFDHLGGFVFDVMVFDPISACARSSLCMERSGYVESRGEKSTPEEDFNTISACARSLSIEKIVDVESRGEKSTPIEDFNPISVCARLPLSTEKTVDVESRGEKSTPKEDFIHISACEPSLSTEKTIDVESRGEKSTPIEDFNPIFMCARCLSTEKTVDVESRGEKSTPKEDFISACAQTLSREKTIDVESREEKNTPQEDFNPLSVCAQSLSTEKTVDVDYRGEKSTPTENFNPIPVCAPSLSTEKTVDVDSRGEKSTPTEDFNPIPPCAPSLSTEKTVDVESRGEKSTPRDDFKPSSHPYFRSFVQQYCFKWHAMLIPTQFARTNNLAKRWCEMILIDQKGRRWPVNLRHRKTGKDQVYLASGWDEFAVANGLQVGDSMVYELLDSGPEPVMKFYKLS